MISDVIFFSVAAVIVVAIGGVLLKRKRVVGKLWRPDGYKKPRRELTGEEDQKMKVSICYKNGDDGLNFHLVNILS